MVLLVIALALFALIVYYIILKPMNHWKKLNVPHLTPLPIIGNLWKFLTAQIGIAEWVQFLYNSHENKRYLGFYNMLTPVLLIKDIDVIKQISIKDFDHFVDHRQFISEDIDPLFGNNLFSLQGEKWRQMRSTLSPAFTGNKMRAMYSLISDCVNASTDYFTRTVKPNEPLVIEMRDILSRISNDVIASVAFGIKCDSLADQENEFFLSAKDASTFTLLRTIKFFGSTLSMKLMKLLQVQLFSSKVRNFFRHVVVDTIKLREKENVIRPDMIHLLMEARKGKLKHNEIRTTAEDSAGFATVEESYVGKDASKATLDLSDDEVTAQALIFILGGFDTVSTVLCHMAYELAINEDIQRKLQNEIDQSWEECNGKLTYEVLMNMKYMDMVISETLRKWPAAVVLDRVCTNSYTIEPAHPGEVPIHLKKGGQIWIPVFGIHRDPKYYPNPEKFIPERFSDENKGNIAPYSYLPFGIGPRNCIGSRFALLEIKAVFFHFLTKFNFELCGKSQVPLKLVKGKFSMLAENGFWLGLRKRNAN